MAYIYKKNEEILAWINLSIDNTIILATVKVTVALLVIEITSNQTRSCPELGLSGVTPNYIPYTSSVWSVLSVRVQYTATMRSSVPCVVLSINLVQRRQSSSQWISMWSLSLTWSETMLHRSMWGTFYQMSRRRCCLKSSACQVPCSPSVYVVTW